MSAAPSSLRVPVITPRRIQIPAWMASMKNFKWGGSAYFFDIDGTLLDPVTDVHRPNHLSGRMLTELANLAERTKVAFITAADYNQQKERVMDPLMQDLVESGRQKCAVNLGFCTNRGGIVSVYGEDAKELEDLRRSYVETHGISSEDYAALESILNEIVDAWINKAPKTEEPVRFEIRPMPLKYELEAPFKDNRLLCPPGYPKDFRAVQISIKPFMGDIRKDIVADIESRFRGTQLEARYDVTTGGRSTIDVNRKAVNKQTGILWLLDHWHIPHDPIQNLETPNCMPVFGVGDEFCVTARMNGDPNTGGDMSMLEIPNLIGLTVNTDQEQVMKLLNFCKEAESTRRIFQLGSGPSATERFLIWANSPKEPNDNIELPVETKIDINLPQPITDFLETGAKEGMLMFSGSVLRAFQFGKDAPGTSENDPTIMRLIELLQKGMYIAVVTGGDFTSRIVPVYNAITEGTLYSRLIEQYQYYDLTHTAFTNAMSHLVFYANGGTVKAYYGKESNLKVDTVYSSRYAIAEQDMQQLKRCMTIAAEEYMRDFGSAHRIEHPLMPANVQERCPSQISLLPILIKQRGTVVKRIMELLPKSTADAISFHYGGYTIDVTSKTANKGDVIADAIKHFGNTPMVHSVNKILYFGSEFGYQMDSTGKLLKGIDFEIFKSPNANKIIRAIAINRCQNDIPEHPLILQGGSGIPAMNKWLSLLSDHAKEEPIVAPEDVEFDSHGYWRGTNPELPE